MNKEQTAIQQQRGKSGKGWLASGVIGFLLGGVAVAAAVWLLMPGMMINVHTSRYDTVDETVAKLKESVEANGWSVAGVKDMQKSLAKQGVDFPHRVKLVEICHPDHAQSVLTSDRHLATLMPCALAVYEDDDGAVRISGMNTGLMGKMFGGNVADVMGGAVAEDEEKILAEVVE